MNNLEFEFGEQNHFDLEFDLMDENYFSVENHICNFINLDMLEVSPQTLFSDFKQEEKTPSLDCSEKLIEMSTEEIKDMHTLESDKRNGSIRGRPRKSLQMSADEFLEYLVTELHNGLRKINSQVKNALNQDRTDTARTSLIWLIKKIPYISLIKASRWADYKSSDTTKFTEAYEKTLCAFASVLDLKGIPHLLDPKAPEGFTSLYLPKAKVLQSAKDKSKAECLLSKRDATSIREVRELTSVDPTFHTLLLFVLDIASEKKFKPIVDILEDLKQATTPSLFNF